MWERAEPMAPNPHRKSPELVREPIYDGRNYDLHRALALGVSAGPVRLVEPVAPPRGVPDDVADETPVGGDPDCFGHSWLLVREIEDYDWDQPVIQVTSRCMAVTPWARRSPPPGYRTVGPPEGEGWEPVGDLLTSKSGALVQCFARPTGRSYRDACADFLSVSLPRLRSYGPADEVRLVFWFY